MEKAEAIIFDLGAVLLDIDYNLTRTAFEKLGVGHFDDMYSQKSADRLFRNLETGKISDEDFYIEMNKCTGLQLSPAEIKQAWCAMLLHFREKSLLFLDQLKPKYRLFLLSNTNHIHIPEFNKMYHEKNRDKPFAGFFEKAYYSSEMGLRKPDAECYEWVLHEQKLEPGKTIFVDDSIQNVEAARNVGMQAILLEPGMYIEDLEL
ncbi:MAG: HAD family phosphatase [Ginsengibacter sp.]